MDSMPSIYLLPFLLSVPSDYRLALNATHYYANILSNTPLNTPVYRIRAIISTNTDPTDISITLSQTGQINEILEFEGGDNNRVSILESALESNGNESVFDTSINLVRDPNNVDFIQYPVKLNVDIQLVILFQSGAATQTTSKGIGSIEEAPGKCLHVIAILLNIFYCASLHCCTLHRLRIYRTRCLILFAL